MNYKHRDFTFLELLIAVLILVIVSTIVLGVFRETLLNYKKGTAYSNISESLAGSYMVMQSDLSKMLPLGDKKTVYFKPKEFSFIAIGRGEDNQSCLKLIRYKIDYDTLKRVAVKFPGGQKNIDDADKNIAFLDGISDMRFKYLYQKVDDKKKKSEKKPASEPELGTQVPQSTQVTSSAEPSKKDKKKKDKIKRPIIVKMKGTCDEGDIQQKFSTAFFVRYNKDLDIKTDTDNQDQKNGQV